MPSFRQRWRRLGADREAAGPRELASRPCPRSRWLLATASTLATRRRPGAFSACWRRAVTGSRPRWLAGCPRRPVWSGGWTSSGSTTTPPCWWRLWHGRCRRPVTSRIPLRGAHAWIRGASWRRWCRTSQHGSVRARTPSCSCSTTSTSSIRQPSLALLDAVAESLPPSSTLVLVGRAHHARGSIGRLRLHPGVVDITLDDLALDLTETHEMVTSMGLELDLDDVTALGERFEGWPAGLRLAGLSLRTHHEGRGPAADLSGEASYVVDYLRAEWTAGLRPDDLTFLREVACLERCTGEMCDAILDRTGSAAHAAPPPPGRESWCSRWTSGRSGSRCTRCSPGGSRRTCGRSTTARWKEIHVRAGGLVGGAGRHRPRVRPRDGQPVTSTPPRRSSAPTVPCTSPAACPPRCSDGSRRSRPSTSGRRPRSAASARSRRSTWATARERWQWTRRLKRIAGMEDGAPLPSDTEGLRACALEATLAPVRSSDLIPVAEHACRHLDGGPWHGLALWALGGQQFVQRRFPCGRDLRRRRLRGGAVCVDDPARELHRRRCRRSGARRRTRRGGGGCGPGPGDPPRCSLRADPDDGER